MSGTQKISDATVAAGKATQGTQGGKVIDAPPTILTGGGPRDALVDPMPGDVIPELETKGYHTGIVAQPAQPVSVDGVGVAGFVSTEPSRFTPFSELKRAPHRDDANLGTLAGVDPSPAVRMLPGVGLVDTSAIHGGGPAPEAKAGKTPKGVSQAEHDEALASKDAEIEALQKRLDEATKPAADAGTETDPAKS